MLQWLQHSNVVHFFWPATLVDCLKGFPCIVNLADMKEEQSSNHSPALLEENGFPSLKKNGWESILRPCEKYVFFEVVALGDIFLVLFSAS